MLEAAICSCGDHCQSDGSRCACCSRELEQEVERLRAWRDASLVRNAVVIDGDKLDELHADLKRQLAEAKNGIETWKFEAVKMESQLTKAQAELRDIHELASKLSAMTRRTLRWLPESQHALKANRECCKCTDCYNAKALGRTPAHPRKG